MIISASYRTDIPAFYASWLMDRIRAGECMVRNPYNGRQMRISLRAVDVQGMVLWTRNISPLRAHLPAISALYPFAVQYTVTNYPRELERAVPPAEKSIEVMRELAGEYGPRVCVWRYDPIVISSLTPVEFHVENFARLAEALCGACDEVVISFMQIYRKTKRNMDHAADRQGWTWRDPVDEEKLPLVRRLVKIAAENRMTLSICSQRALCVPGAAEARCIDAKRLEDIGQRPIESNLRGNRKECCCYESRDIGAYDTCPHGCAYCYAVADQSKLRRLGEDFGPVD